MISTLTKTKLFFKFALRDIECGAHSGFKPCCIFCYAILDNLSNCHKRRFHNGRRYLNRIVSHLRGSDYGYIPCPICLFKKPVKVLKCDRGTDHPLDFVDQEEMDQFISIKDLRPLHKTLVKIDKLMNLILENR